MSPSLLPANYQQSQTSAVKDPLLALDGETQKSKSHLYYDILPGSGATHLTEYKTRSHSLLVVFSNTFLNFLNEIELPIYIS